MNKNIAEWIRTMTFGIFISTTPLRWMMEVKVGSPLKVSFLQNSIGEWNVGEPV